ncbi:type II toxin-antitoxin system HipA family toxin [Phytoactinopolyspora mesophila]|uniref:Type II toxin-antitoxin system HipA family toxin n=1 Tax=Phytoactinopolyspora mesophila TaxID=2650750 RepID=A0A7K3MD60_9ACTN|nr:HipA domain-containing protein [Phytoactinopolyspora mesophila]NDL60338.1 type II toxin-antitoxin system HipA family toxin [Phytoactinopolyspora mesophila]
MSSQPEYALDELVDVGRADVYKQDSLAGHLEREGDDVLFRYTDTWLERPNTPIATTLPLTDVPHRTTGGAVPAFFAGLLPEGRRLSALRRATKTSPDDELTLLLGVGQDVVGDVQVVPEGCVPGQVSPLLEVGDEQHWGRIRFADIVSKLDTQVDRVGLAGVQDKVSAAMVNLPIIRAGHRFILKLEPPEYRHLVDNENFFIDAARKSGLDVVDATMLTDADGAHGLLIRRFDRYAADGIERSLAVEDGCQVLGRHPAAKYRMSTEDVFTALSRVCGAPVVAARTFLAQLAFAYVTGNGDAHAKNFSVMQVDDDEWRPTPLYDVPNSQPYGDNTLAMPIGGRRDAGLPDSAFVDLGRAIGVPERASRKVLADIAAKVDVWLPDLERLPFDTGVLKKLRRVIERRRATLERNAAAGGAPRRGR